MSGFVVAVLGGVAALGVLLVISVGVPAGAGVEHGWAWQRSSTRAAAIGLGATAALVVSGWVVGAAAGALAVAGAERSRPGRWPAPDRRGRVEAMAVWCEQLRVVVARGGTTLGAVGATARRCPAVLRPYVMALGARLGVESAGSALAVFAEELDDPSAHLLAVGLLHASTRPDRAGAMLGELATAIHERAGACRGSAAPPRVRRCVTAVVTCGVLAVGILTALGRQAFLGMPDRAGRQVALAVVVAASAGAARGVRASRSGDPARPLVTPRLASAVARRPQGER